MTSKIPEARSKIECALLLLQPLVEAHFEEVEEAKTLLEAALEQMTRTITKKSVRCHVELTPAHREAILSYKRNGSQKIYTCAEIAIAVFGQPCHLGRVSAILSGREDEYMQDSKEHFGIPEAHQLEEYAA